MNDIAYSLVTCRPQGTSWSDSTGICYDWDALQDSDLLANNGIPSVSAYCVGRNPVKKLNKITTQKTTWCIYFCTIHI